MLRKNISAYVAGLIFGLGLMLSGMTNPDKVIGFLDLAGQWDPSLMLVMVGAITVSFFAFQHAKKRSHSYFRETIQMPTAVQVDRSLLIGAVLFGVGWGLLGICPGPALALLTVGDYKIVLFILSMLIGMETHRLLKK